MLCVWQSLCFCRPLDETWMMRTPPSACCAWQCDMDTPRRQGWAAMPRRARDALKKADTQVVDALEHRMLTALAEAEASAVRCAGDSAEVTT